MTEDSKRKIRTLIIFILIVGILVSGYFILKSGLDYYRSRALYEDIKSRYVVENKSNIIVSTENDLSATTADNANPSAEETHKRAAWSRKLIINLEGLQEENSDIIGWLYFENEDISYPILYSGDNETYLKTSYLHEYLFAGSIFMDENNIPDFSSDHTILYGHNMNDLSMFGRLRYYYQKNDYYDGHRYFQIITNEYYYRYEIIAYKQVPDTSDFYTTFFSTRDDFETFINDKVLRGSMINSGVNVTSDDSIVSLSTCSSEGYRFVVSAVRIATEVR